MTRSCNLATCDLETQDQMEVQIVIAACCCDCKKNPKASDIFHIIKSTELYNIYGAAGPSVPLITFTESMAEGERSVRISQKFFPMSRLARSNKIGTGLDGSVRA